MFDKVIMRCIVRDNREIGIDIETVQRWLLRRERKINSNIQMFNIPVEVIINMNFVFISD